MSKLIYVDMDDVIADFGRASIFNPNWGVEEQVEKMYEPGFFRGLQPVPGAQVAIRELLKLGHDVQILTQPLAESGTCYREKAEWIAMYFPELIKKINMTQDKGNFIGDFLIDDNATKWKDKFEKNGGKFIHFTYNRKSPESDRKLWEKIVGDFKTWDYFEQDHTDHE